MKHIDSPEKLNDISEVMEKIRKGLNFPGRAVGSLSFDFEKTKDKRVLVMANYLIGGESFKVKDGTYQSMSRAKEVAPSEIISDLNYRLGKKHVLILGEKKDNKQCFTITHDPMHKGFNYAMPKGGYKEEAFMKNNQQENQVKYL